MGGAYAQSRIGPLPVMEQERAILYYWIIVDIVPAHTRTRQTLPGKNQLHVINLSIDVEHHTYASWS